MFGKFTLMDDVVSRTRLRGYRYPAGARRRAAWVAAALAIFTLTACQDLDSSARRPDSRAPRPTAQWQGGPEQGIDLRGIGYDFGSPDAPVAIVEFSDFGCPYCGAFALESFPRLYEEFIATGKVQWKYVPFVLGIFPNGDRAASAGICAAEQGDHAFWLMHDLLYEKQREWRATGDGARELFERYAAELRLDARRFIECYDSDRAKEILERNNQIGRRLGVRATPTFFINGARVEGAIPLELFRRVLQEATSS